jgi:hypothetical protein
MNPELLSPHRLALAIATALTVAFVSAGPTAQQASTAGAYTLTPVTDGMQLKTPDGRVVFDYLTKKPADVKLTSPSAACFHPVLTPSGERVSALAPDDHPHHRGVYLAWHDSEFRQPINTGRGGPFSPLFGWNVTKADFWGWGVYAPRDNRLIENTSIKLVSADAARAELEIHNDWKVGQRKFVDETNRTVVSERDGVYVMDLQFRVATLVDYQLNKASFGGFNLQARKDGESYFTSPHGQVTLRDPHYSVPELNWPASPWYGYVITLTSGKVVGAVVVDHPLNPPSTWHNSRTLWMLNPVISALGPLTIRPDTPLTLRYRVIVHDGATPTAVVEKLATEFRATR